VNLNVSVFSYFTLMCAGLRRDKPFQVTKEEMQDRLTKVTALEKSQYWWPRFAAPSAVQKEALKNQREILERWMGWEESNHTYARYFYPEMAKRGPQHPTCDAHEVVAHVFGQLFRQALHDECLPLLDASARPKALLPPGAGGSYGGGGGAGMGTSAQAEAAGDHELPWKCMIAPTDSFSGQHAPDLHTATADSAGGEPRPGFAQGVGEQSFPAFVEDSSWVWAEDKKGRPGWIALPGQRGRIRFQVNASLGWAVIGFLETYAKVGVATCQLGDGLEKHINARISTKVSVMSMATLRTGHSTGMLNVTCQTDGNKFKITSLQSC